MATMKAVRIHEYGGPEVLKYEDAPRPQPTAGEVLSTAVPKCSNTKMRRAPSPRQAKS